MPARPLLPALVVVALLAATGLGAWLAWDRERDDAAEADRELVREVALDARQAVTVVSSGLKGSSGIVEKSGTVEPDRFRVFASSVLERSQFLGISWAPLIREGERQAFEDSIGRPISRLGPDGGTVPLTETRDEGYLPTSLTYPATPVRRAFIGFDIFSDPTRERLARSAISSREARLTPPILLAESQKNGAALYEPVRVTVRGEPRVLGLMVASLPGAAIATEIRRQGGPDEISIMDDDEVLAGSAPGDGWVSTDIQVLGRRWAVSVESQTTPDPTAPVVVGMGGLALTLAAAGLFVNASRRERDLSRKRSDAELRAARESLLTRISEVVDREIGVDQRLVSLARTLVPAVGDVCVVHEVTAEGVLRRVGVSAVDESLEDLIRAMPEPTKTSPIRAAISSREPVLYTRTTDRDTARDRKARLGGASPEEILRADERSNLIVPLVARGNVLGAISLTILKSSGRAALGRDDVAFGMEVATHGAVALDNARLYEQQRDIAAILQGALLPRSLPPVEGAEVAVRHRPGKAGTEVGGDFYDLFEVGSRWMAVVGDVCGKGPEAASLTALVRHTLRATAELGPELAVQRVHDAIKASGENTYCTLCCAELESVDGGIEARITTAGHPEPRVVEAGGGVHRLDVTGPLVGVLDEPVFAAQTVTLRPGSTLFMCSDGVPEARRSGEVFGDARLEDLLGRMSALDPADILERLEDEVVSFVEGRQRDDLALFALRVGGSRPADGVEEPT